MKTATIQSSGSSVRTTKYESYRGMDTTADATKIDNSRSPYAPNLISDGGYPEKRPGYRTLIQLQGKVHSLFYTVINETLYYIAHVGTCLYKLDFVSKTTTLLKSDLLGKESNAFSLNGKLWILTGAEYLVFDGATVKNVLEDAYIPTTIIARPPNGKGGKVYESVNLLQSKRTNSFLADGTTKIYQVDSTNLDVTPVTVKINDIAKVEGTDFTVNRTTGQVTFTAIPPKPTVVGQDNVSITFAKSVEGYYDRVAKCTIASMFGVGTNDRVFVSGNKKYRAQDWHSELNSPSYFPDLNYSIIGSQNTAIMGYHKIGENQAIIKEDNSIDNTIFLRTAKLENFFIQDNADDVAEMKAIFPLKQGIIGVGAISKKSFASLLDEPLFLSRTGIYAITSNLITAERTVQNRSYFIDSMLSKEANIQNAVATAWNGLYIVCLNSHCYILDGKQNKTYKPQSNGDYVYECYYWTNIPATCFMEHEGVLYFGTDNGNICRFNTDIEVMTKYNDDGTAIHTSWTTKADDDGDFMRFKTMTKRGGGLMIKPYTRSSATAYVKTDTDELKTICEAKMDIFDFDDIDFNRFSFNTNENPQIIPFETKVKKYITAQLIVESNGLNEGFGVLGLIKRYSVGNFAKRRR